MLDAIARLRPEDKRPIGGYVPLLRAAVSVAQRDAALVLTERLACVAHVCTVGWAPTSVSRQLGDAAAFLGDPEAARANYAHALQTAGKIGFRPELALTHLGIAELLVTERDYSKAFEHLDLAIPELRDMQMQLALERGLRLVEQVEQQAPPPASDSAVFHVLTGREQEVARLLATGHSNREIADMSVISEATVEVHVKHILAKLGFRSRAQVAAWAASESR
jgi:DNA-binding CsgD family transcriptional regulator